MSNIVHGSAFPIVFGFSLQCRQSNFLVRDLISYFVLFFQVSTTDPSCSTEVTSSCSNPILNSAVVSSTATTVTTTSTMSGGGIHQYYNESGGDIHQHNNESGSGVHHHYNQSVGGVHRHHTTTSSSRWVPPPSQGRGKGKSLPVVFIHVYIQLCSFYSHSLMTSNGDYFTMRL